MEVCRQSLPQVVLFLLAFSGIGCCCFRRSSPPQLDPNNAKGGNLVNLVTEPPELTLDCGLNMMIDTSDPNGNTCKCALSDHKPFVFHSESGNCYEIFTQGFCTDGFWLTLNENGLQCSPNTCLDLLEYNPRSTVLYYDKCINVGDACGQDRVYSVTTTNIVACISNSITQPLPQVPGNLQPGFQNLFNINLSPQTPETATTGPGNNNPGHGSTRNPLPGTKTPKSTQAGPQGKKIIQSGRQVSTNTQHGQGMHSTQTGPRGPKQLTGLQLRPKGQRNPQPGPQGSKTSQGSGGRKKPVPTIWGKSRG